MAASGQSEPKGAAKYNRFRAGMAAKQTQNHCMMYRNSWQGVPKRIILYLSRFSAGFPLLIPTDRAAPSYQLLVLSLASLPFVLFVAITDVLSFGARTAVRSFLDIIFGLR
jgi:hypothetical protein